MKQGTMGVWLWGGAACVCSLALLLLWKPAQMASARPSAPVTFCEVYADSPLCSSGQVECKTCHTDTPPGVNPFGEQVKAALAPGKSRPLSHQDFSEGLKLALKQIETKDADSDGVSNLKEIQAGYHPGDSSNKPTDSKVSCEGDACGYDPVHAYKKVSQDFCGQMLTYEQLTTFKEQKDQRGAIKELLSKCLDTPFWNGKDGVVWKLAHNKIRPAAYAKAGTNPGPFPVADYEDDYNLFVYTQTDNHDARQILLAQFFVDRKDGNPTTYAIRANEPTGTPPGGDVYGRVAKERRAGIMTTPWTLSIITMFSVIPRGTAAQMYRAYLGLDIAKREGLYAVRNEPADYDNKSVRAEGCIGCHQTLDAMSYPFSRYNGLTVEAGKLATYIPDRMKYFTKVEGPRIKLVPEAGFILGKRVKDLLEWAKVAANSDQFAKATVMDYWKLLLGAEPSLPKERTVFEKLWKDFKTVHQYSVERMLHAFVQTEVYGAP